uniref:Uncharacterized protein n=1 Tax=Anguilla anguilla TaxID=7936 RepID=A0A0E9WZ12_ANGAN
MKISQFCFFRELRCGFKIVSNFNDQFKHKLWNVIDNKHLIHMQVVHSPIPLLCNLILLSESTNRTPVFTVYSEQSVHHMEFFSVYT